MTNSEFARFVDEQHARFFVDVVAAQWPHFRLLKPRIADRIRAMEPDDSRDGRVVLREAYDMELQAMKNPQPTEDDGVFLRDLGIASW